MKGGEYRDRVAAYIDRNFSRHGLLVYTEVEVGKSIIGKRRKLDVFVRKAEGRDALGIECKFQQSSGTTDEKIPYALEDLAAMWIPGCLVYAGAGWSQGILHTLEGSRLAAACLPPKTLTRGRDTLELDHVLAACFGLWDEIIPSKRRFSGATQMELPEAPLQVAKPDARTGPRKSNSG